MTVTSMTGFGQAEMNCSTRTVRVEIRSVNHRFSDLLIRTPRDYGVLEERCRQFLQNRILRGRVEITVAIVEHVKETLVDIDFKLIEQLQAAEQQLLQSQSSTQSQAAPHVWLSFPGVVSVVSGRANPDELWADVRPAVEQAAANWLAAREREGSRIQQDLLHKLGQLRSIAAQLSGRMPQVGEEAERRLRERIDKIAQGVDDSRLWTEVALLLDKLSIDEELLRLSSHLDEFERTLAQSEAVGRRLDFLIQEMNREVNTIGSKSVSADISRLVVDAKTVIEQMREQVQNIA